MSRRAVFLDRDGVLNWATVRDGRPYPPENADDLKFLPGVEAACRHLSAADFLLIGATNQPDIARGTTTLDAVESINEAVVKALELDDIRMCPHDDADGCDCRKPRPGLLRAAARDFDIDLQSSIMVGDRWRDVEAGIAVGCRTVFIDHGYDERLPSNADFTCEGLAQAVPWIIGGCEP